MFFQTGPLWTSCPLSCDMCIPWLRRRSRSKRARNFGLRRATHLRELGVSTTFVSLRMSSPLDWLVTRVAFEERSMDSILASMACWLRCTTTKSLFKGAMSLAIPLFTTSSTRTWMFAMICAVMNAYHESTAKSSGQHPGLEVVLVGDVRQTAKASALVLTPRPALRFPGVLHLVASHLGAIHPGLRSLPQRVPKHPPELSNCVCRQGLAELGARSTPEELSFGTALRCRLRSAQPA